MAEKYDQFKAMGVEIYKVTMDGKTFFQPHFKSDFNMDLRSHQFYEHIGLNRSHYKFTAPLPR